MKVIVPLLKGQFCVIKKGKKVNFLELQIGNLMNCNIYSRLPQIRNLATKTAKENKSTQPVVHNLH